MNKQTNKSTLLNTSAALFLSALLMPAVSMAGSGHGVDDKNSSGHMNSQGHMAGQEQVMEQHGRMVTGMGRINKVMSERHMVNIVHEPIAELEWPKMRMNFKVSDQVKLDELKPGQEVEFKLQVNKDNSYMIKSIEAK